MWKLVSRKKDRNSMVRGKRKFKKGKICIYTPSSSLNSLNYMTILDNIFGEYGKIRHCSYTFKKETKEEKDLDNR